MKLQVAQDWADLVLKVMSIIAITLGGWWAYYQFVISETTASNDTSYCHIGVPEVQRKFTSSDHSR